MEELGLATEQNNDSISAESQEAAAAHLPAWPGRAMSYPLARFPSSFPPVFHSDMLAELNAIDRSMLFETVPLLSRVRSLVEDPVVLREVKRMLPRLGAARCVHTHLNKGKKDGGTGIGWHKDDPVDLLAALNEDGKRADDGLRWFSSGYNAPCVLPVVLLCYFPQKTTPEMGPTEARWDGEILSGAGDAGTLLLARHDVPHQAPANIAGTERYMLKFIFGAAP